MIETMEELLVKHPTPWKIGYEVRIMKWTYPK
jgi:hypothetical protein